MLKKQTPIAKLSRPFLDFMHIEASGGFVLLACTLVALAFANSPWEHYYTEFWHTPIALSWGSFTISHSLAHWITDGLMTIFFFVVGLEIKRELVTGELKDPKAALLPALAALGGALLPALIYKFNIAEGEGAAGWGIPMATDIAFVVGFLSLLGSRVPHGLKIFVLSLAIVDDLGAIVVIAAFYSSNISIGALALGALGLLVIVALNRLGVRRVPIYIFVGALIWSAFLASGIHPTIAGVLLGLLTPASAWIGDRSLFEVLGSLRQQVEAKTVDSVSQMITMARESVSPLERLEVALHPWVAFFIMPIFALANAGVRLNGDAAFSPISLSVAMGLIFGKPIGILLFSWLAVRFAGAKLPKNVSWKVILGAGFLSGIGFTMSLFVAGLAFEGGLLLDAGKVGTLMGSAVSAAVGLIFLYFVLPKGNEAASSS